MSTIRVEDVTKRLYTLSPHQLAIVDDFLVALIGRSRANGEKTSQLEERPISRIEELRLGFWPVDESVDDFLTAREMWRTQDIELEKERAR